jgi:hypothetical protein
MSGEPGERPTNVGGTADASSTLAYLVEVSAAKSTRRPVGHGTRSTSPALIIRSTSRVTPPGGPTPCGEWNSQAVVERLRSTSAPVFQRRTRRRPANLPEPLQPGSRTAVGGRPAISRWIRIAAGRPTHPAGVSRAPDRRTAKLASSASAPAGTVPDGARVDQPHRLGVPRGRRAAPARDRSRAQVHTARMRTHDGEAADDDPVAAMHDTEAESGDEEGLQDTYDLDEREAAEVRVDLDPVAPTEPELD